ncbi:MAG: hypothetical protein K2F88_00360 [Duncaniella sp.]|nr:hypothetical protein [Duncaniella sp.]
MRILFYGILLMLISGCSCVISSAHGFEDTEKLIDTDPEEAFRQLNAYDVTEFEDSATMARWALLYSEAMAASRLWIPTDTIINIAIDYYGRNPRSTDYLKACSIRAEMEAYATKDDLATALYRQKEKEFFLYKERTKRQNLVFAILFVVLLAGGVIIYQRQRLRIKSTQNETLISEASHLREAMLKQQSDYSRLECKLSGVLEKRFRLIDELCETYYQSKGTAGERKMIAEKVKSQIEALRTEDGLFREMELTVNDSLCGFTDHLREALPDIKADDYRLAVYLAANLSNRTIALLLGESIEVVYKRKSRLKGRIAALDSRRKEQLMSIF